MPGALAQDVATIPTSVGPASVVFQYEGAGEQTRADAFLLRAPTGDVLLEASLPPTQIARARSVLRRQVLAVVLGVLAVTLILLTGPLLDRARGGAARHRRRIRSMTIGAAILVLAGAAVAMGRSRHRRRRPSGYPVLLLVGRQRRRRGDRAARGADVALARPPAPEPAQHRATPSGASWSHQLLAGIAVAARRVAVRRRVRQALEVAPVDLQHFSLHPWSAGRLTLARRDPHQQPRRAVGGNDHPCRGADGMALSAA